jgi:flagellar motor switch protein FliN/FliY
MTAALTIPEEQFARIANIRVEMDVEMDRRILTMREILALKEGSLIDTTRSAGENIDIYIGGALVGFGEIVVIENMIGVRITDFKEED